MYEDELKFLRSIPEIKEKESPLSFTRLEVLILLKGYKEQLADHKCKPMVNADWTYLRCECGKTLTPKQ
jgi:hypothetical protein